MFKPKKPLFIDDRILQEAFKNPDGPLSDLGKFIFYGRYSRWRDDVNRREYWAETTQRSVEYNVNLAISFLEKHGRDTEELRAMHQEELNNLFDNQFNLRQALAGRTLWIGGTPASYLFPISNFNCSFMIIDSWEKFGELIYLGMVGTGIGIRILRRDVAKLDPIKSRNFKMVHKPYEGKPKEERAENSFLITREENGYAKVELMIGDSKEGWREAVDLFFNVITSRDDIDTFKIIYDNVRPAGERLKTFGGRAGGPNTIKEMFETFDRIIKGTLDENYEQIGEDGKIKPIHALDFANAIGKNIISGDVRSIAEIILLDPEDRESINAKSNIFGKNNLNHRFVSNNSVFYEERPTDEQLEWQFDQIEFNGEPCFVNAEVARRRRADFEGVNPCVEILLRDRGLCNLTTVNFMAFVKDGKLDMDGLEKAFVLATRAGLRMTLPTLELEEWDKTQQEDRLLGVSMTGYQDAMDAIGKGYDMEYQRNLLAHLKQMVRTAADEYADLLGVNRPLLTTCVKPEGTISQLFGGVSSGVHVSHDKYFIRRIRSSATDPMSRAVFDLGWRMHAEYQDGSQHEEIKGLLQYVPAFSTDDKDLKPEYYYHHNGTLFVKFTTRVEGDWLEQIERLNTMANAYYNQDIKIISKLIGDNIVEIEYTANDVTYYGAFGRSTKVVIDFPQHRPSERTKANFGAIEQLETYKMFLEYWAEHNPSNTITVRPEEWGEVRQWVKDNWDSMLAVSFLTLFDAPYPLLPFQTTTKEDVENLRDSMQPFSADVLMKYDIGEDQEIVDASCDFGACPVR